MAGCLILAFLPLLYLTRLFEYLQYWIRRHIAKFFIQKYCTICLFKRLCYPSFNLSSFKLCSNNGFQLLEHMHILNHSFQKLVKDIQYHIFMNIHKEMIPCKVSYWMDLVWMLKAIFFNLIFGILNCSYDSMCSCILFGHFLPKLSCLLGGIWYIEYYMPDLIPIITICFS